jgi:hypothetical protein
MTGRDYGDGDSDCINKAVLFACQKSRKKG